MGNDTLKCGYQMYQIAPGEIDLRNGINTNNTGSDADFNPPMHAGGGR